MLEEAGTLQSTWRRVGPAVGWTEGLYVPDARSRINEQITMFQPCPNWIYLLSTISQSFSIKLDDCGCISILWTHIFQPHFFESHFTRLFALIPRCYSGNRQCPDWPLPASKWMPAFYADWFSGRYAVILRTHGGHLPEKLSFSLYYIHPPKTENLTDIIEKKWKLSICTDKWLRH